MRTNTLLDTAATNTDGTSRRALLGAGLSAGGGLLAGCFHQSRSDTDEQTDAPQTAEENRVLIVFFSRTENTQAVAEIIQQEVGGDMFEVHAEEPYPVDYDTLVSYGKL